MLHDQAAVGMGAELRGGAGLFPRQGTHLAPTRLLLQLQVQATWRHVNVNRHLEAHHALPA
jgi:hypothetical protein